jgi:ElaA protein
MNIACLSWDELSTSQLYDILQLRQEVFIVEQDCPYLDADGKDQSSYHVVFYENGLLIAYTRLVPKGISYENYVSIGRVLNKEIVRGRGIGKELMTYSIQKCKEFFSEDPIKISAQVYLLKFYTELGFVETGERYLEDGIPHCAMVLSENQ